MKSFSVVSECNMIVFGKNEWIFCVKRECAFIGVRESGILYKNIVLCVEIKIFFLLYLI